MADQADTDIGPTPRAVALARAWLNIGGVVWLGFAVGIALTSGAIEIWPTLTVAAIGLLHFAVARFGSRRVAVFFAVLGP